MYAKTALELYSLRVRVCRGLSIFYITHSSDDDKLLHFELEANIFLVPWITDFHLKLEGTSWKRLAHMLSWKHFMMTKKQHSLRVLVSPQIACGYQALHLHPQVYTVMFYQN